MKYRKNIGFTLMELMIAAAILLFCLSGLLATYFQMFILSDLTRDLTLATNAAQAKIEEIRSYAYTNINAFNSSSSGYLVNLYDGATFNITGLDGRGAVEACDINTCPSEVGNYTDLIRVWVEVSFRSRGKVIGEDSNLNGILDTGEDKNNNTLINSPVESMILIAK